MAVVIEDDAVCFTCGEVIHLVYGFDEKYEPVWIVVHLDDGGHYIEMKAKLR